MGSVGQVAHKVWQIYAIQRIVRAVVTIFVVTTITFFLLRLMPSNPLDVYINSQLSQGIPLADAQAMAAQLYNIDLDRPLYLQYFDYLGDLLHGDFGMSISSMGTPVSQLILRFLPWTLFVVTASLLLSFTLGTLLGMLIAFKRESWLDHLLSAVASLLSSIPDYLVGILILVYFGVRWKFFDVANVRGALSPGVRPEFTFAFFKDVVYHAALPIITYVLTSVGHWMLMMKSSTIATLGEDYVTVARARGLTDGRITMAYVGRNAVLPLFTALAIRIGFIVGGSVFIEFIFTYQGIGLKLQSALITRDYPVMQAVFIIITTAVVSANLLADLVYSKLDPRIRTSGGK